MIETITLPEMIEFYDKVINPSSPSRTKLSIFMNSQVKPGTTSKFSVAASQELLKDLKSAQVPVDEVQYANLSKSEPPVETALGFFSQYLDKVPFVSQEKKTQLLERVKELARLHPVQTSPELVTEGKLKEGTIIIDDLVAFRKSLEMAKPARPVMSLEEEGIGSEVVESKL